MDLRKIVKTAIVTGAVLIGSCVLASADTGLVIPECGLNLRSGPGTNYSVITTLQKGSLIEIDGTEEGWLKCTYDSKSGYVSSQYVSVRRDNGINRSADSSTRTEAKNQQLVNYAAEFLGTPYVYGGTSPSGFDCSGFVYYVYKNYGYVLNRTAAGQASNGIAIAKSDLAVGDIVLFRNGSSGIGHAGIYVGNGQFIHSPKPGSYVKYDSINSGYYANNYVCARRIIY